MLKRIFRTCLDQRRVIICRGCASGVSGPSTETGGKWDLLAAVCLERRPVVTPPLNRIEAQFAQYLSDVELERSLKSDHEMRHESDRSKAKLSKSSDAGDLDLDSAPIQTAQDFEDACNEELARFELASRQTDEDVTSLQRRLHNHLVLVTEQRMGAHTYLLPPQGARAAGETLRQAAERVLREACGSQIGAQIMGNAPAGFYKYRYPRQAQGRDAVGAKVFIFLARYLSGQVVATAPHCWLDRRELCAQLPASYHASLSRLLVDEPGGRS